MSLSAKKPPTALPISELTLRDYFAGQALYWCQNNTDNSLTWRADAAACTYKQADAMLAARNRK